MISGCGSSRRSPLQTWACLCLLLGLAWLWRGPWFVLGVGIALALAEGVMAAVGRLIDAVMKDGGQSVGILLYGEERVTDSLAQPVRAMFSRVLRRPARRSRALRAPRSPLATRVVAGVAHRKGTSRAHRRSRCGGGSPQRRSSSSGGSSEGGSTDGDPPSPCFCFPRQLAGSPKEAAALKPQARV
jgi:hypothetical protein